MSGAARIVEIDIQGRRTRWASCMLCTVARICRDFLWLFVFMMSKFDVHIFSLSFSSLQAQIWLTWISIWAAGKLSFDIAPRGCASRTWDWWRSSWRHVQMQAVTWDDSRLFCGNEKNDSSVIIFAYNSYYSAMKERVNYLRVVFVKNACT